MQTLILISFWAMLALAALLPVLLARRATRFWPGFWRGQAVGTLLIVLMAWWAHASLSVELWWMGDDVSQLSSDGQDRAFHLTMRRNGVGWPIYAIAFLPITVAYFAVAYVCTWHLKHR